VIDSEGDALRHATRAEPNVVTPNEIEAEELVGHEFSEDEDRVVGVREIAELGAQEAIMTLESGCLALVGDEPDRRLYRVSLEPREPRSAVGSGDAFLAGYLACRYSGSAQEDCLRFAVACGSESTQHFGAGVIEPREVDRLLGEVEVEELAAEAVEQSA
jgi:fructose-1-phosphate kinase PfkB-like protein